MSKMHNQPIAWGFYQMALKTPNNPAIYVNERHYSYREVLYLAGWFVNQLKHIKGQQIALLDNNDILTYSALLGISLAGKTYVPLNRKFPTERNAWILEESEAACLISSSNDELVKQLLSACKQAPETVFPIDEKSILSEKYLRPTYQEFVVEGQNAYILFTSGSTGVPKGVGIPNEFVHYFFDIHFNGDLVDFNADDRFLQMYSLSFDVSVLAFFTPLQIGASVYIVPHSANKHFAIAELLLDHDISVACMVPSVLNYLQPYLHEFSFPKLRYSIFSGEALPEALLPQWRNCQTSGKIMNFYGLTETTIHVTSYNWQAENQEALNGIVPIGKLFPGLESCILDENEEETAIGELCIRGPLVIIAYFKNRYPERFVQYQGKQYYRTGDIVSFNEQGNLIYRGRIDSQVQIDGFRVELSEIEFHLTKLAAVNKACVLSQANRFGAVRLYAFVESQEEEAQLIGQLKEVLPNYMIPVRVFKLDQLPLNSNGKTDKKALRKRIPSE